MSANPYEFNRGVLSPMECLRGGWDLIKDRYWLFLGISVVGILIGSVVPMGILLGPMMCGIYLALFSQQRGEPVNFEMLFKGFDYLVNSIIATLIQMVPMIIVLIPIYVAWFAFFFSTMKPGRRGAPPPDPLPFFAFFAIVFVVVMLVSLIVHTFFIFTYPLIVDRKLSGVDAVKTSFRAAVGNLGGVIGLVLLTTLLGFGGLLLCYVGAIFVMPITFAANSIAYRQVFSLQDNMPPAPPVFTPPPPPVF
jgi:hypothetical protein